MTRHLDELKWFASIKDHASAEATAETAAIIMDLIRAGLVFRNFTAHEVTYDLTDAGKALLAGGA